MTYPDGTLLKSSDEPAVWLIQDGQRDWIPSVEVFNADGFSWAAVLVVSDAEIDAIPQGPDVPLYTTWTTPGPDDPVLPGPQLPTVEYAGYDYKRWRSSGGGHTIYGRAQYITQTGLISGETITMNAVMFTGYHSGTSALITNTNGIVIYSSPLFRVGVNPKGMSGQTVVSTNAWSFDVPGDLMDQAAGFAISLSDSPDNLSQILGNSVGSLLTDLASLVSAIGAVAGGSKKTSSTSGAPATTTTSPAALRQGWEA
jgi:hypothetical protein